jgi:hypothetical protein
VNRSRTNYLMVVVLLATLIATMAVMPGQAGATARQFGHVATSAAQQMHDGYMKLFH